VLRAICNRHRKNCVRRFETQECRKSGVVNIFGAAARYRRDAVGSSLQCSTSGAAVTGLCATIKYLRGAAGIGLGTTIKYLRRTTSAAAGSGLGATNKYLVNQIAMSGQEQGHGTLHKG
jgi:hypothetical protein